jgi:hypothetical protein
MCKKNVHVSGFKVSGSRQNLNKKKNSGERDEKGI